MRLFVNNQLHRTTNHHFCNLRLGCSLRINFSYYLTATQDSDAISNSECLFQFVGNKHNTAASSDQCLDNLEELDDLFWCQHRGWFVEYHDLGIAQQHFDDLDALLHTNWQIFNDRVWVKVEVVAI